MIYDFECKGCGEKKEISLKVSERDKIQKCDKCQGEMVRVISACGHILKGGGWYGKGN